MTGVGTNAKCRDARHGCQSAQGPDADRHAKILIRASGGGVTLRRLFTCRLLMGLIEARGNFHCSSLFPIFGSLRFCAPRPDKSGPFLSPSQPLQQRPLLVLAAVPLD